ncbi:MULTISPECIES: NAD(P)/FAD-dependent oxidoreductase [unclassified Rhizobacter]|uniref:NAD(P)/FAD-dependent oxidoreductase n=1 Tax=unclassified Rhizobacter TaxID=2640088 RepID=UPI0006F2B90A|nr:MULTISPECIES: NAD(P)/FAD-dependent oxidoreductase [unclassified Rhizobacter]KQU76835.1 geranylgeranyl reductase [Rhizobacter sp. Root29]KQV97355.1 geranylgeranyl reductase [Rhizobacter sp. Root1238]KRB10027.1 geranylgeranyl reductase [Rhizobacter sp. Root16D2]
MPPTQNTPLTDLPERCEVLVVGAGPAGSAAALWLARAGVDVVQVDQHRFPRDKVCGDGLIPDAHAALARLGVLDEVMAQAQAAQHVGCIGPRGGRVDVPGTLAVLPRRELDQILCRAAVRAGAKMFAPAHFEGLLHDAAGRVSGATLSHGEVKREIHARWVLLATGAVPQALIAAGVCERQTPSGIAMRTYIRNPAMAERLRALDVVWDRRLRPGYGWIFPCRDGVFNVGVGVANSHRSGADGRHNKLDVNLRQMFASFCEFYEPARELLAGGELQGPLKGAPLRCTLKGAVFSRPGLLVTGEAAGSTYSFTGEGIGKAMETGLLAAEAVLAGRRTDDDAVRTRYEAALCALQPRFALYERANGINAHPWLADLVIWRAQRSARLRERMSGVLNETSNPGTLLSLKGVKRLFLE